MVIDERLLPKNVLGVRLSAQYPRLRRNAESLLNSRYAGADVTLDLEVPEAQHPPPSLFESSRDFFIALLIPRDFLIPATGEPTWSPSRRVTMPPSGINEDDDPLSLPREIGRANDRPHVASPAAHTRRPQRSAKRKLETGITAPYLAHNSTSDFWRNDVRHFEKVIVRASTSPARTENEGALPHRRPRAMRRRQATPRGTSRLPG